MWECLVCTRKAGPACHLTTATPTINPGGGAFYVPRNPGRWGCVSKNADWLKTHLRCSALPPSAMFLMEMEEKENFCGQKQEVRLIALDIHTYSRPSLCGWGLFVLSISADFSVCSPSPERCPLAGLERKKKTTNLLQQEQRSLRC